MKAARYTVASGLVLLCAVAQAQPASPQNIRLAFDIHAKQMEEALTEFAQATQLQVLFPSELVREQRAPNVSGALTPEAALKQLLANSQLKYEFVNANTVAIRPAWEPVVAADWSDRREGIRFAENDGAVGPSPAEERSEASLSEPQNSAGIPEVLVKGSRSLNADIERTQDDVRPYVVFDRETIRRSSAIDVNDFMRKQLTMSSVPVPNNVQLMEGDLGANTTQIALRGLSANETLILVDGRRITSFKSGLDETQSDINSIPLSAIERIEVLPATASGIFGGNATGGVVNVVLRRDYTGIETSATFQNSIEHGGAQRSFDIAGGLTSPSGRTSVMFLGSYSDNDPLLAGDRSFLLGYRQGYQEDQIARFPTRYYNAGAPSLGATLNISSVPSRGAAPNLVLRTTGQSLNSPITSLPVGYTGVSSDSGAALVSNAGRYNVGLADSVQLNGGEDAALFGGSKVGTFGVTVRQEITSNLKSFLDVFASRNDSSFPGASVPSTFTISSASTINPFRQSIRVNVPIDLQGFSSDTRMDSLRAVVGLQATVFNDWSVGGDYSFSTTVSEQAAAPSVLASSASNLISSGTINVFQDPANYSDQLAALLQPAAHIDPAHARLKALALRAAGPLFALPAGNAALSVLAEGRDQHYGAQSRTTYDSSGEATVLEVAEGRSQVKSLYAEVTLPFASATQRTLGLEAGEFQVAGRFDHYELRGAGDVTPDTLSPSKRVFSSVDPSVGLRLEPLRGLALRGSYGTGFLPPQLYEIQEVAPLELDATPLEYADPKRGGEFVGMIDLLSGGNAKLQPEESRSRSLGAILTPAFLPNLRFSFDWTRIHKRNNITVIGLSQTAVDQEDLVPGVIIREAAAPGDPFGVGRIVAFDQRNRNVLRAMTDSYDMTLSYTLQSGSWGLWEFSATATRLVHNLRQSAVDAPAVERAATISYPAWLANAYIRWTRGPVSLGASARYIDSNWLSATHTVSQSIGVDHLPSSTYVDVLAEYDIGAGTNFGPISAMKLSAGVKNVLNTPPNRSGARYDSWGDYRMATYFVSLRTSLGK